MLLGQLMNRTYPSMRQSSTLQTTTTARVSFHPLAKSSIQQMFFLGFRHRLDMVNARCEFVGKD